MKLITLTQGQVTQVDDEDFEYLNQFKWFAQKHKYGYYAGRSTREGRKNRKRISMQQELIPNSARVDHRDGNGLNNQRTNLRPATPRQNSQNQERKLLSKTGFKGVGVKKKKWYAHIRVNGIMRHLGYFRDPVKAALAYNRAAVQYFGEFARPNIIKF